ncbi:hypothetical protein [Mangrovicoccus algicola]|uniref:PH domain-containing protein n=1 Tax=Mangrovicoccus algicola TaxID=2771008 RepID=A0A8J6YR57_9RHOB|nr:hypothetical protein [Mangrovicoccus algicola]MBE3638073.1 hypothetical protein [Mangrovicoccus algicola]
MQTDPWAGLLDPGERILWQGQPDAGIDWRRLRPVPLLVGAIFAATGTAICGMGLRQLAGGDPMGAIPALFGLAFVAVGLRAAVGDVLIDAWRRSRSWYTLTSARMLVATDTFGRRRLRGWPIDADTVFVFEEGPPGSVLLSGRGRAGFRRIDDARHVYALARQVQRDAMRQAGP